MYEKEGRRPASDEDIAKDLGYNTLNGTSRGLLSALKKYGLLRRHDDGFKVSDDAVALIELPHTDVERAAALHRVAFRPMVFAELYERYRNNLPSDSNLRHFLVTKGFNPKTTDEVIRIYRDTLRFVSEESAVYTEAEDEIRRDMEPPVQPPQQAIPNTRRSDPDPASSDLVRRSTVNQQAAPAPVTVLQLKTSQTSEARIELIGDVTQDSIDMLVSILEVQKLAFPKGNHRK